MMRIRVQCFSVLKDVMGAEPLEREFPEGTTVGAAVAALRGEFPGLAEWTGGRLLLAVGVEFAGEETILCEGDVLSLMPPVQGG